MEYPSGCWRCVVTDAATPSLRDELILVAQRNGNVF
jgi:hypothetical protein